MKPPAAIDRERSNWKLVLGGLLVLPLVLAVVLSRWLGTPRETFDQSAVFAKLGTQAVATNRLSSLAYGELFFVRVEVSQVQRAAFLKSLEGFEVSRGTAQRPISLELERDWWTPPQKVQGTYWKRGFVTVWNPDPQPDSFFAVAMEGTPP